MGWTEEKVNKLKDLWGKGQTASQIAEIIGGVSRNAVIGKAHRLNLSAKIKTRSSINHNNIGKISESNNSLKKGSRKHRFRSLLLDKNFEPAKNLKLEDLNENTCKYMEGHPDEKDSIFCATGITSGDLVKGIKIEDDKFISETLITHKSTGLKKIIKIKQKI